MTVLFTRTQNCTLQSLQQTFYTGVNAFIYYCWVFKRSNGMVKMHSFTTYTLSNWWCKVKDCCSVVC